MPALMDYLTHLRNIHASGAAVKETSYYGALETLLNQIGRGMRPRVHCIINISNRGAGIPDGGLFTADQLKSDPGQLLFKGQLPARGVVEAKGTAEDVLAVARTEQVQRYWEKYGQVLVTNLRDFLLVGKNADGDVTLLERYTLSDSEAGFWAATSDIVSFVEEHDERFKEFLRRILLHAAPLTSPKEVAWMLASYARDAKARITGHDLPALAEVRSALEQALGLKFEGEKGEQFFQSTLVQTLFYGVFSAWVLWSKERPYSSRARFDWRLVQGRGSPWWVVRE